MFSTIAQSAGPAFRATSDFMTPVLREAGRNAAVHAAEIAIVSVGAVAVTAAVVAGDAIATGSYRLLKRGFSWISLPYVHVTMSWDPPQSETKWDPSWSPAPAAHTEGPTIDGEATTAAA